MGGREMRPVTRFAWNGDDALAYQVIGPGPDDLLYFQGGVSNVELNWDTPIVARFLEGLARNRRLIVTDPRGVGCSERSSPREIWPLELMMEDLNVVMNAAGSERAMIFATNECAFAACMFAATYPERTAGLILYEAAANWLWSEETPWEWTVEQWRDQEEKYRSVTNRKAAAEELAWLAPSLSHDPSFTEWWFRYSVLSCSPGYGAAAAHRYMETDIRGILPAIHVPVLVLVRPRHPEPSWRASAPYVAELIPGAQLVQLPGVDGLLWVGDHAPIHRAVDSFHRGLREEEEELNRVLATVLFTDIVHSTATAWKLGDRDWRRLVERHHVTVRSLLERYRGVEVDTAGDGFYATFDGPARAIRCGRAIVEAIGALGMEARVGIHTGECEMIDGKLGGVAVIIGARVGAKAAPSEVLVSQTVRDLVAGSGLNFDDRGEHELPGIPGRSRLFRVAGVRSFSGTARARPEATTEAGELHS